MPRDLISLACGECKRRNYTTTKNKKTHQEKLEVVEVLPLLPKAHGAQGRQGLGEGLRTGV